MASQNIITEGPTSFTWFPKLPRELRMMIWKQTLPGPRILELEYHHGRFEHDGPVMQGHFTSPSPLHVILATCQESRHAALNQYNLTFPGMAEGQSLIFDPEQDIVVLSRFTEPYHHAATTLISGNDHAWDQVQHICITADRLEDALGFLNEQLVDGFPGVRTVMVAKELGGPLGTPLLKEPEFTEDENRLCAAGIEKFETGFAKKMAREMSDRKAPTVTLKAVTRTLDGVLGKITPE